LHEGYYAHIAGFSVLFECRYYNMTPSPDMRRDTPTPPPGGLSKSQKNRSPYSSSGSLNISGDSIENVLRRKKKVRPQRLDSAKWVTFREQHDGVKSRPHYLCIYFILGHWQFNHDSLSSTSCHLAVMTWSFSGEDSTAQLFV